MGDMMKKLISALIVLGIASFAVAQQKGIAWSADEIKWLEVPNSGGVTIAPTRGAMMKGAYSAFMKFPAGSNQPLHTHTSDCAIVVVSGTYVYGADGQSERKLGPGSYLLIPGGMKHTNGCAAGSACVIFIEQPGKFDVIPAK